LLARDTVIGTEGEYTFQEIREREALREEAMDDAEGRHDLPDPAGFTGPCAPPARELRHTPKKKITPKKAPKVAPAVANDAPALAA
jgi:hypothetical protein